MPLSHGFAESRDKPDISGSGVETKTDYTRRRALVAARSHSEFYRTSSLSIPTLLLLSFCAGVCLEPIQGQHVVPEMRAGKGARRLQQSALQLNARDPVSATTADLVDDPTGRGHLLVNGKGSGPTLTAQ